MFTGELANADSRMAFLRGGGKITSAEAGARLLCWPRDSILHELTKLASLQGGTSLLEQSWMARTPLALCLTEPSLLRLLHPTRLSKAAPHAAELTTAGDVDAARSTLLILGGEVFLRPAATVEVDVTPDAEPPASPTLRRGPSGASLSTWSSTASLTSSASSPADEPTVRLVVQARMPAESHSLEAVANMLEADQLRLRLRRASCTAPVDQLVTDTFKISAPLPADTTAEQATAALRAQLQLLGATRMRAGELLLGAAEAAADGGRALDRCEPALLSAGSALQAGPTSQPPTSRWARLASTRITESLDPPVALFDIGVLGASLALASSDVGRAWRAYLYCHAPALLPESLHGISEPKAALQAAEAARKLHAEAHATAPARQWREAICSFLLYRLREEAGVAELGMRFNELALGPKLGEGSYGVVRLARQRVSGRLYAVKSIEKQRIRKVTEQRTFELLERERRTLQLIGNHKVRRPHGSVSASLRSKRGCGRARGHAAAAGRPPAAAARAHPRARACTGDRADAARLRRPRLGMAPDRDACLFRGRPLLAPRDGGR